MAFLNFKPFYNREDSLLRDLHFGGSVDAGIENNPLSPAVLTTSAPPAPSGAYPWVRLPSRSWRLTTV